MAPLPPPVYAYPSLSKMTQVKLVIGWLPKVPFWKRRLVASAGFQNLSSLSPIVTNRRSSAFFDHATSTIFSFDPSMQRSCLFFLMLWMITWWSLCMSTATTYLWHGLIAIAATPLDPSFNLNVPLLSHVSASQMCTEGAFPTWPVTTVFRSVLMSRLKMSSMWNFESSATFFATIYVCTPPNTFIVLVGGSRTMPSAATM
mmetsp:Transcript_48089/g.35293  ORF Transcript_48089/g.35293 Transcript_48089/m.35293 type:complete len:201 (+) Transcript_48089:1222-1824(+)